MSRPGFFVILLVTCCRALIASEILNPSDLPASYALGSNTVGLVWFEGTYTYPDNSNPPFNYHWSGIIIGAKVDTNGNVLASYIATPMHAFSFTGESVTSAGTGNYFSQNGIIFSDLTSAYQSPLWNPNNAWGNAGDIAIFSTTASIPTNWIRSVATGAILNDGDIVTSVGYGNPSTPNGNLAVTGNPMGFNTSLDTTTPANVVPGDYFSGFMGSAYGISINGAGNTGDSGAIVLNESGNILGMTVGGTGGPTDQERTTVFENWSSPDFYYQIAPYLGIMVTPPTLNFQNNGRNLVLSWAAPFVLQSSTNVVGGFTDITNAASPYTNAMTAPQMFFHLRSN